MDCGAEVGMRKKRIGYGVATLGIFLVELFIALFVRDKFIVLTWEICWLSFWFILV